MFHHSFINVTDFKHFNWQNFKLKYNISSKDVLGLELNRRFELQKNLINNLFPSNDEEKKFLLTF